MSLHFIHVVSHVFESGEDLSTTEESINVAMHDYVPLLMLTRQDTCSEFEGRIISRCFLCRKKTWLEKIFT